MLRKRTVTRYMLLLIPAGVLINFIGVRLALRFGLPLFLDSIGTVLAAVLGGYLPGITVGFLSNIINGFSDPITLYYGIISIIIAAIAAYFAKKQVFRSVWKSVLMAVALSVAGGGLGSVLTWLLYGFEFGSGISAPYAIALHEQLGVSEFNAQFIADMAIDLLDKAITVGASALAVRLLPDRVLLLFPQGRANLTRQTPEQQAGEERRLNISLRTEVIGLIAVTSLTLGTVATVIGLAIYKESTTNQYIEICRSASALAADVIDADRIDGYLENLDESDRSYIQTEKALGKIRDCFPDVEFLYVYRVMEDGCHVVFDMDTADVPGAALGEVVEFDPSFEPYIDTLLSGGSIEPVISNDTYGWLLTVYRPICDSEGGCAAYVAVDVDMAQIVTDRYAFIIRVGSLLFGAAILLTVFAIALAERRIVEPLLSIADAADRFTIGSGKDRERSMEQMSTLDIRTGDEIESLYSSVTLSMNEIVKYVNTISNLQENTLHSFADLVESRDHATGEHIRRTSVFVRIIARQLAADGKFTDTLTQSYIDSIESAAPLHDVGKITISDAILNKPGRLTPEEFDMMKKHVTAGRDIITGLMENTDGLEYLFIAREMAEFHHERWDGGGYAAGISGEQIPLCARIMAVSDVYDALISQRSYKSPLPSREALELIKQESGTHFDPTVVASFERAFAQIERVTEKGSGEKQAQNS